MANRLVTAIVFCSISILPQICRATAVAHVGLHDYPNGPFHINRDVTFVNRSPQFALADGPGPNPLELNFKVGPDSPYDLYYLQFSTLNVPEPIHVGTYTLATSNGNPIAGHAQFNLDIGFLSYGSDYRKFTISDLTYNRDSDAQLQVQSFAATFEMDDSFGNSFLTGYIDYLVPEPSGRVLASLGVFSMVAWSFLATRRAKNET